MKHLNILCLLLFLCSYFTHAQIENVGSKEYGRLMDVQYHSSETDRLYARTLGNHIVTSDDNGEAWDILYSFPESLGVEDLKYMADSHSLSFYAGNSIYILDIETLQYSLETDLPIPPQAESVWIDSYYIHPSDADFIIVSQGFKIGFDTFSKVYYTTDGGEEWQEVYYSVENDYIHVNSVALNPSDSTQLYIFRGNSPEDTIGGLFISEDSGETWEEKLAGYTLKAFDFNPDDSQELLVGTDIGFGNHEEKLFKSTDAGNSWDSIPISWTDKTLNNITNITYKPNDPNTVIVLEENEIVVTEDDFDTWENYVYPEVDTHSYYYGLFTSFNPSQDGEVYISSNYHVLHSDNNAEDLEWAKNPFFQSTGQYNDIYQSDDEQHLYYGVQYGYVHRNLQTEEDTPYFVKPLDYVSLSPNMPMFIDKRAMGRVYVYEEGLSGADLKVSINHGDDEETIYTGFKPAFDALASYPSDNKTVIAAFSQQGSSNELVKIDYNDINQVETTTLSLPIDEKVNGIFISAENDLIVIAVKSSLYKSIDEGESWEELNDGLEDLQADIIFDLVYNPLDENQLTIATSNGIYTSYNQGEEWEKLKEGRYNKVEHSPVTNGDMVALSYSWEDANNSPNEFKVSYTNDAEENWEDINYEDLYYIKANTGATLFKDNEEADVYIGTSDIGVIKLTLDFTDLSIPDYSDNNDENNILIYPNPAEDFLHIETKNNINISRLSFYAMNGKKIKEEVSSNKIDVSSMPSGIYLLKILTNSNEEIVKRFVKK